MLHDDTSAARPGPATDNVHETLRRLILDGELEPGAEISQLELSKKLHVSRTPLREALRLLEREGLVVNSGPHRLVRIAPLSMRDLDDLYSLRVTGEALAIWLTVPVLGEADIKQLNREIEIADAEAHRRFHARLRIGAGERLQEHLDRLFEHAERYQLAYRRGYRDKKLDEHRALVEACAARDQQLARELIVDHIASVAMGLMTAERHAPFSLPSAVAMAKGAPMPAI